MLTLLDSTVSLKTRTTSTSCWSSADEGDSPPSHSHLHSSHPSLLLLAYYVCTSILTVSTSLLPNSSSPPHFLHTLHPITHAHTCSTLSSSIATTNTHDLISCLHPYTLIPHSHPPYLLTSCTPSSYLISPYPLTHPPPSPHTPSPLPSHPPFTPSLRSLMELHKRRKALTEPEVRYFLKQILLAVQHLHNEKVHTHVPPVLFVHAISCKWLIRQKCHN